MQTRDGKLCGRASRGRLALPHKCATAVSAARSRPAGAGVPGSRRARSQHPRDPPPTIVVPPALARTCLLYTSDAADEEDSVDLGGRRIIKKKKKPLKSTQ